MAQLIIEIDPEILKALTKHGEVKISVGSESKASSTTEIHYREGSLPERLLEKFAGKEFDTHKLVKAFKVSRAHASMLLTKLTHNGSIERIRRGIYRAPDKGPK